ncbi:hypothetical protein GNY06_03760 [Elizabethkingia argentiflava]|uniref:Uncharacterized protein n=1 Tax=Elizabethkingia argenteiflava TaxID=2681556 RepID=A0A845PW47_9FLAO|nr:DUF6427 family protein [Elizabethkingia argenteiflava]NAW50538.1 hypothetical protein [Elizabethkingia argenteiflava]
MFRLLSKQTNIFSIPIYLGILLGFVSLFNVLTLSALNIISSIIAFLGIALGYILFNHIGLNRHTHLPFFIYSLLIFTFYFGQLSVSLAFCILIANLCILILTHNHDSSYLLLGCLTGLSFVIMPSSWPLVVFVLIYIFATSNNIAANILRLFFGIILLLINYICFFYILNIPNCFIRLIPYISDQLISRIDPLIFFLPTAFFTVYSICIYFFSKSTSSNFNYIMLVVYSVSILLTLVFYMDTQYEFLLLLALPVSVIASRGIHFTPNDQTKEFILWLIIISSILFKLGYYF